jgi:hypothetical protein
VKRSFRHRNTREKRPNGAACPSGNAHLSSALLVLKINLVNPPTLHKMARCARCVLYCVLGLARLARLLVLTRLPKAPKAPKAPTMLTAPSTRCSPREGWHSPHSGWQAPPPPLNRNSFDSLLPSKGSEHHPCLPTLHLWHVATCYVDSAFVARRFVLCRLPLPRPRVAAKWKTFFRVCSSTTASDSNER